MSSVDGICINYTRKFRTYYLRNMAILQWERSGRISHRQPKLQFGFLRLRATPHTFSVQIVSEGFVNDRGWVFVLQVRDFKRLCFLKPFSINMIFKLGEICQNKFVLKSLTFESRNTFILCQETEFRAVFDQTPLTQLSSTKFYE